MSSYYTAVDHFVLLPARMLIIFGCAVLLFDFLLPHKKQRKLLVVMTFAGLLFTGFALLRQNIYLMEQSIPELVAFGGSMVLDRFSLFFNWMFLLASGVVALISWKFLEIEREPIGEYYGLLLLANAGMYFLATGIDLVTIAVGLELMALCFYILTGFSRADKRSNEAAVKYLLLGAFSTAFLLYGFSLLYGISGSTRLHDIAESVSALGSRNPVVFIAIVASAVGLLFKISAVPFHMWAPDAYEGAPTPVSAYLAVASKAASFALLTRIFLGPLLSARVMWEPLLMGIAILSLTIGNLAALTQDNIKRLLAFSSISHAGYILLGLVAGNSTGVQGIAVYVMVYAFMTLGAFLIVAAMRRDGVAGDKMDDLRGLIRRKPGYAIWMLIFLMSLAGLPPTAGFIGKYYIFLSLLETGHYIAAVIAGLYAAVALYYYFRIVKTMFAVDETELAPAPVRSLSFGTAIAVTGVLTLIVGIFPEPFLRFARISPDSPGSVTRTAPAVRTANGG